VPLSDTGVCGGSRHGGVFPGNPHGPPAVAAVAALCQCSGWMVLLAGRWLCCVCPQRGCWEGRAAEGAHSSCCSRLLGRSRGGSSPMPAGAGDMLPALLGLGARGGWHATSPRQWALCSLHGPAGHHVQL
jgi:hypothetical protein